MRRALAPALVLALAGCDRAPPIPEVDLLLRVASDAQEVESGKAFGLTVVRVWSRDWVPAEWSDRALAPLVVRLEDAERREEGGRVEETRRYRGYAFARDDVLVPAPSFRARRREGGDERVVAAAPIRLRVKPALPPTAPAEPEPPGEPLPEPRPWLPWALALAAVALGAVALAVARARRGRGAPPPAPPAPPPAPSPATVALERLRAVAARPADGAARLRDDVAEVSGVVREYLGGRFGLRALEMTSEELRAAAEPSLGAPQRALLSDVLGRGDWAKFAAGLLEPADRRVVLGAAETLVRQTAPAPAPESVP